MRALAGPYRCVRALGDESMTFGDWLRNAWAVDRAQREAHAIETASLSLGGLRSSAFRAGGLKGRRECKRAPPRNCGAVNG